MDWLGRSAAKYEETWACVIHHSHVCCTCMAYMTWGIYLYIFIYVVICVSFYRLAYTIHSLLIFT